LFEICEVDSVADERQLCSHDLAFDDIDEYWFIDARQPHHGWDLFGFQPSQWQLFRT